MNLVQEHNQFWYWAARVMRQFMRVRPGATLIVIAATGISGITKLLAFFLPLKVLLLAGSDGVPRYFPFIDPSEKAEWIIGLTIGTFVAYGLTLLLEALAARYSEGAGKDVLLGANQMSVHAKEDVQAKKAFADFSGVMAAIGFVGLGVLVLAWVNPLLLGFLVAATLLTFALSSWLLRGNAVPAPKTKRWIVENSGTYLAITSSLAFFGGFLVILYPFLRGGDGNILLALLGIILSKQMLSRVSSMADTAGKLQSKRHAIDALIFRNAHLLTDRQKPHAATLQALFAKQERERRAQKELAQVIPLEGEVQANWVDSPLKGMQTLVLVERDTLGKAKRYLQQQIVPPLHRYQLINEAHLFDHIPRECLKAPTLVARFEVEGFHCQVLEYGTGRIVPAKAWSAAKRELLLTILSLKPPKALIASYRRSRPTLAERLTDGLMERLDVAVDTPAEADHLRQWRAELPALRSKLKKQPLAFYNPDLSRAAVVPVGDDYLIMAWGRWALEPFGAALKMAGHAHEGQDYLGALQAERSDLRSRTWPDDLELGAQCVALETAIQRGHYKRALTLIQQILATREAARNPNSSITN